MSYLRAGSILFVDLSTRKTRTVPTEKYIGHYGGRGINIQLLLESLPAGADPLGPQNVLIFGTGPLSGTMVPGSGRTEVTGKSPLTGLLGSSNIGGYWAAELKYAGYDNLVITGMAEKPAYLTIVDGKVEIRDAGQLWGVDTYDVLKQVRREMGEPDAQAVSIGKAGENLVKYASILTKVGNAAGRTGMGTVMGSKRLKAIAVRGTNGVALANPEKFYDLCQRAHESIRKAPDSEEMSTRGTTEDGYSVDRLGLRSHGNYHGTLWSQAKEAGADVFFEQHPSKRAGCFACPVRCMEYYNVPDLGAGVVSCSGYVELTWKLQKPTDLLWWESLLKCQKYGIDPSSVSGMIAWATELFEKRIIDERDTDGVRLEWGSREAVVHLIEKIANREGFGSTLADGPISAAERIGRGSEEYLAHVRNLPLVSINSMNYRGMALAASVGPRGDSVRGGTSFVERGSEAARVAEQDGEDRASMFAPFASLARSIAGTLKATMPLEYEGKARLVEYMENLVVITDLMGSCKWHSPYLSSMPMTSEVLAELYAAGSG